MSELTSRFAVYAFLAIAPSLVSPAMAQVNGDPAEGHRLAETWCTNCHIVDRSAVSGTSTGAPSFPGIAAMKSVTPMGLSVFLQTPHDRMPDLHLTRAETDDLIAYILSLRRKDESG